MKITILANKDIASNFAINMLLPKLSEHEISIFLSSQVGGDGHKPSQLKSLQFFEQDLFNELVSPILQYSVQRKSGLRSFTQFNELVHKPIQELNHINSPDGLAQIKKCEPDLIISIRYGVILKNNVIGIPKFGVFNLHSGLLPFYRGVMATFWAMLNDEKVIGTTLHYINDSSIDTGNIVATSELCVDKSKSYLWHVLQLYTGGCELIMNTITSIVKGENIDAYVQPEGGGYFTFPTESDLVKFSKKGFILIDEKEMVDFIKVNYY